MRITNRMITRRLLATITMTQVRAAELQLDLATTKKIRKPSDDPSGLNQAERFKVMKSRNEQYSKNITQIRAVSSTASAAVDSLTDLLDRAKTIAIQGASDTVDADARLSLAKNIDQIIDDALDLGNTKFNNKSVFGGTLTIGVQTFTRSGDVITFNGNSKSIKGQIGFETQVSYNKTGEDLFDPTGGTDIFATLVALKQGLEANDTNAIQSSIDALGRAISQTTSVSAEFGVLLNKLSRTEELIESENIRLADAISKIEDTDIVGTIIEFQRFENAITTGMQAMARTIQTSLIDFIR